MSRQRTLRLASSGIIVSAALVVACSQAASPTKPSALTASDSTDGRAGGSAAGDVKTGSGNLEIIRVRVNGTFNANGEYANPGGTYRMATSANIELWVEWDANNGFVPAGTLPRNPRLTITWGAGEVPSPEDINCGLCKLSHRYTKAAIYTVTVTLDDLTGTKVVRTFFLDSTQPAPPTPTPTPTETATPTPTPIPSPSPSPSPGCGDLNGVSSHAICP